MLKVIYPGKEGCFAVTFSPPQCGGVTLFPPLTLVAPNQWAGSIRGLRSGPNCGDVPGRVQSAGAIRWIGFALYPVNVD